MAMTDRLSFPHLPPVWCVRQYPTITIARIDRETCRQGENTCKTMHFYTGGNSVQDQPLAKLKRTLLAGGTVDAGDNLRTSSVPSCRA
jgi:hypothetical protein